MKKLFLSLIFCSILLPTYAERTVVTQESYYPPYYDTYTQNRFFNKKYNNSYFSDISALEKYALNKTYKRDSDLQRLQRLEMTTFGSIQSGDLDSRYDRVSNAILSRPKQNYKTSLLRNLGNYLSGQMTGYTPSLLDNRNSYYGSNYTPNYYPNTFSQNSYPSSYDNGKIVEYGSGPFNTGYRINNFQTGSSSGITILD